MHSKLWVHEKLDNKVERESTGVRLKAKYKNTYTDAEVSEALAKRRWDTRVARTTSSAGAQTSSKRTNNVLSKVNGAKLQARAHEKAANHANRQAVKRGQKRDRMYLARS
jgi:hypothetical protein